MNVRQDAKIFSESRNGLKDTPKFQGTKKAADKENFQSPLQHKSAVNSSDMTNLRLKNAASAVVPQSVYQLTQDGAFDLEIGEGSPRKSLYNLREADLDNQSAFTANVKDGAVIGKGEVIHVLPNSKRLNANFDKRSNAASAYYPSTVLNSRLNVKAFDRSAVDRDEDPELRLHTQVNAFDERSALDGYMPHGRDMKPGLVFSEEISLKGPASQSNSQQ